MYDDLHSAPRGVFSVGTLTNAAQGVGEAAGTASAKSQRILGGLVQANGAVERVIIFRRQNAGAEYFRLIVRANTLGHPTPIPPFYAVGGLEVLTTVAAADLLGVITYWLPT